MGEPVGRLDNSIVWSQAIEATPGRRYATAAEAETAARRLAAGGLDTVIRTESDGYRVDTIDEVDDQSRSSFRSNQLQDAAPGVAAFVTGRGASVGLRTTRDGSTDIDRVASTLQRAGLTSTEARELATNGVDPVRAANLFRQIAANNNGSLRDFGPRVLALRVLATAADRTTSMSPLELSRETVRHGPINVVRPDGYVARLSNGEAIYRAGNPAVRDGKLVAGDFQIGQLLYDSGGVMRETDGQLRPGRIVGERPLEGAGIGETLDGVQDGVIAIVGGVYNLVAHPIRSLDDLSRLPENVRTAIANRKELADRFMAMSGPDQTRAVANMITQGALFATGVAAAARSGPAIASSLEGLRIPPLVPQMAPALAVVGGRTIPVAGATTINPALAGLVGTQTSAAITGTYIATQGNRALDNVTTMTDHGSPNPSVTPAQAALNDARAVRQRELSETFTGRRTAPGPIDEPIGPPDARIASNPARGRYDAAFAGPQGYTQALERARLEAGDLGANRQVMRDPKTDTIIGERSADGKRGWRIDEDHANWWNYTDGAKGEGGRFGHSFYPRDQAGPFSLSREYAPWEILQ